MILLTISRRLLKMYAMVVGKEQQLASHLQARYAAVLVRLVKLDHSITIQMSLPSCLAASFLE